MRKLTFVATTTVVATMLMALVGVSSLAAKGGVERPVVRMAVFPLLVEGAPDPALVRAVNESLESLAALVPETPVLAGDTLRKTLKTSPYGALVACKDEVRCIARLGKKAGAAEVLVGQARASTSGASLMFIAFSSEGALVLRKVRIDAASVDEARAAVPDNVYALLGVSTPGSLLVSGADSRDEVRVDDAILGEGPGPYEVAPGRHTLIIDGIAIRIMVHPSRATTVQAPVPAEPPVLALIAPPKSQAEPGPAPASPPAPVVAPSVSPSSSSTAVPVSPPTPTPVAVAAPSPATTAPTVGMGDGPKSPGWSNLRKASVVLAVGAVAALVVGIVYSTKVSSAHDRINALGSSQKEVDAAQKELPGDSHMATASYAIGGGLLAVGAILLGIDSYAVATPVAVTGGSLGVQASVGGRF